MPAERTVTHDACGHQRTTKANPGVALLCPGCFEKFLAPPIDESAPAPARDDRPGPPASTGVVVDRARPVIPQRARPRARAGEDSTEGTGASDSELSPEDGPPAAPPAPSAGSGGRDGKTGDIETLTHAGRRGGLASYARSKIRA